MNEPILCSGNDLAIVCEDIRARGGMVESLDAGIGGNGGWRVNYFDGGKTIAPKTPSGAEDSRQTNGGEARRTHLHDRTAVIPERFPFACGDCDPCLGGRPDQCAIFPTRAEKPPIVTDAPGQVSDIAVVIANGDIGGSKSSRADGPASASIPTGDILPQVKGGGLNADQQPLQSVPRACLDSSIEDRMAALQERLSASGKLRGSRIKTPTPEARLPYRD